MVLIDKYKQPKQKGATENEQQQRETNFRRELFHEVAIAKLQDEIVIPWLIMITSLLSAMIEGRHTNLEAFLVAVVIGIIALVADFSISKAYERIVIKRVHVALVLLFVVFSIGVKLDIIGSSSEPDRTPSSSQPIPQ